MSDIASVHDLKWYADVPRSIWKQTLFGLLLLVLTFGGFGTWALTAPLASAVISQGSFVATGQNKIVQHFGGGVIKELMVSEGDIVEEGQPLVLLDETAAAARDRELFLRRARLEAIAARLQSQYEGVERMRTSDFLKDRIGDAEVVEIVESQKLNFDAQHMKLEGQLKILEQNMLSLEFRAEGYDRQKASYEQQLVLLKEEHDAKSVLFEKGLLRGTELKALERAIADAEGQIGRLDSEIDQATSQVERTRQEIEQAQSDHGEEALDKLQSIQSELDAVREQSREAENVLQRASIMAPVSGTVVRSYYHTNGGVIESGKTVMEILPRDVPLLIEAQVPRTDIDSVRVGQPATIRLTALNQRTTPVLEGHVVYVSADALSNEQAGKPHDVYMARIDIPAVQLARVRGFQPTPGMPAEIMIQIEERTFFDYLAKPVVDSMSRAFTER
ncbi:HlyD family type I secretion periplasmic adaptor subunit [Aliihoeflea aestuarii]|jgi:HlyD family type I secretion membrane fusion protein|uniref:HlyD family type I secretion periplasmic adaptor subunit n=1 Tax=Aliihoeflea aestuarii TaxID=453840 RepID=UPI002093B6A1|nr:HlyD family type I secretion periplasmic adaptor subunit [Aliihoeflea aestuarii]MCO6389646.1 HlyD family type I secretion periplasmic adaptor subunit [Aliihoeflea aestuarii]